MNDPKVYLDENNMRMAMNVRNSFVRLADGLLDQGKRDSAITVLDRCNELVPNEKIEYNYYNLFMVNSYFRAASSNVKNLNQDSLSVEVNTFPAATKKADDVIKVMAKNCEEKLKYFFSLEPKFRETVQEDIQRELYIMQELSRIAGQYGEKALSDEVAQRLTDIVKVYQPELLTPEKKK